MNCIICKNLITNNFTILQCNCKIIYHTECINIWFKNNLSCPICRKQWKKNIYKSNIDKLKEINHRLFLESININSTRF